MYIYICICFLSADLRSHGRVFLVSSRFISFHLVSSYFFTFLPFSFCFFPFHLVSSCFISFHLVSSYFFTFFPFSFCFFPYYFPRAPSCVFLVTLCFYECILMSMFFCVSCFITLFPFFPIPLVPFLIIIPISLSAWLCVSCHSMVF